MPLERVLEPEVMDQPDDALDYDRMDHREVNRQFVDDLLAALAAGPSAPSTPRLALDLGTGTAQIVVELCGRQAVERVVAVDYARSMLAVAGQNLKRVGLERRVALVQGDAKRLPFADGRLGLVISNSILHHIAEPLGLLAEARRVCAPGGLLFFRDLVRPSDRATLEWLVETYAAGANSHQRQLFADSLHAALTVAEVQGLVGRLGFDPAGVRATSDRHWTWAARRPSQDSR